MEGLAPYTLERWLFGDAHIMERNLLPFMVSDPRPQGDSQGRMVVEPAFRLAMVNTACRHGVYEFVRRELAELVSRIKFFEGKHREVGAALFEPGVELANIAEWETRHGTTLPSHVRLLLRTVGAAIHADHSG